MTSSIDTLLEAAEYLDRCDQRRRDSSDCGEHGYASTMRECGDYFNNRGRSQQSKAIRKAAIFAANCSPSNRTSHNELEKNRRAHLRNCLEKLKSIVPLGPEASKHTTLGLLTKATRFIKNLEDKERKHSLFKEQLNREHRFLRRRVETLTLHIDISSKRRSVSECSTLSSSTTSSSSLSSLAPSPISESDEVDVIGYTSAQSGGDDDTDTDQSSVQSGSSDSGVAMSTSRLTLSDVAMF